MQARHLQNSNYPGHESNMQQLINNIVSAIHSGNHADALLMARELAKTFPNDEGVLSLLAIDPQSPGRSAEYRRAGSPMRHRWPPGFESAGRAPCRS